MTTSAETKTETETQAAPPTGWRRLPRTVWVLVLARAVNRLGAFTLPFLSVVLVDELGASVAQAGYLLAAFGLATIPSRLLGGRLADRIGGRATIVLGLAGTATAQLLLALSRGLAEAGLAVVLLGLVFEVYEPPSQSTIADVTAAEQRPTAYGLLGASMAAAATGAGLLAALLTSLDLRWLFVVDAATCLTCAAMVFLLLPARPGRREDAPAPPPVTAWRDRRLLALMAAGTVFAVVYLQVTIALPLTLGLRGQPPSAVGLLLALSATTMVLLQPLAHRLRRLDDFAAMTLAYVALAAGLALTGLATSLPTFAAATVVWSLGDLVLLGRAYTVVADIAPETHRGRYLAVYGLCWGVAAVAAPLLGTQLLAHSGPATTWTSLAVLCLALAAAQPALRRRVRA